MSLQIYAHIAYMLIMVIGGGYLGYRYGSKSLSKVEQVKTALSK